MPQIDCQACGHALAVPDTFESGAAFTCAHCGLIILNNEAARAFCWAEQDPYRRRFGATRRNLWGGAIGSCLWILFPFGLCVLGLFPPAFMLLLTAPYLFMIAWLFSRRAGKPAGVWIGRVWVGLGAYLCYVWTLLWWQPEWMHAFVRPGTPAGPPPSLLAFGLGALLCGVLAVVIYRLRARRLPRFGGEPPKPL